MPASAPATPPQRVLLVDDEESIRKVLALTLRDMGHEVLTAGSGQEALAIFRAESAALPLPVVVTDVRMPGMDGLELLRRIKELAPDAEVVIITGHGDMDMAVRGLRLGAADFIHKPVDDEALEIAVSRAGERAGLRASLKEHAERMEALAASQAARIVELERRTTASQAAEGMTAALCSLAGQLGGLDGQGSPNSPSGLALFHDLPFFVAVLDSQARVISVNQLYRERVGDMTGRPGCEAYLGLPELASEPDDGEDEDRREDPCPAARAVRTRRPVRGRARMRGAGGRETEVMVHATPILNSAGAVELVLEIAVDVGEARRLQDELATAQERLADLGLLLASLSHGVKGMLTALDGAVYKVDSGLDKDDPDRTREGWKAVKGLVARIKAMILDILMCAKKREPELQTLDARAFLEDVADLGEFKAQALGAEFTRDFADNLGAFRADPVLLSAALVNLLENAADAVRAAMEHPAAPENPPRNPEVVFRAERQDDGEDGWLVIEVIDNGVGMSEETRRQLFQVFFSTKASKGTGLGLYITRLAVTAHKGRIEVESAPGKGSRFRVRLPAS